MCAATAFRRRTPPAWTAKMRSAACARSAWTRPSAWWCPAASMACACSAPSSSQSRAASCPAAPSGESGRAAHAQASACLPACLQGLWEARQPCGWGGVGLLLEQRVGSLHVRHMHISPSLPLPGNPSACASVCTRSRQKIGGFDWTQPYSSLENSTASDAKRKVHVNSKHPKGARE